MTAALKKRRTFTPEQFARRESEFAGYELVDGYLEKKGMSARSSSINALCSWELMSHVRKHQLGHVFESECMYQCCPSKPEQIRKPDVSFIRKGRFENEIVPDEILKIAPDFIIEVLSKNDRNYTTELKVEEFLEAGTTLIWVVSPITRTVVVFRPGLSEERFWEPTILSADPVVPGFEVAITSLLPLV